MTTPLVPEPVWDRKWERKKREFRELVEAYHARWDDDFYMGEVARLHSPAVGVTAYYFACEGCDCGGMEGEPPGWPCRTAEILINRMENEPL